jgi:hypothetical protein
MVTGASIWEGGIPVYGRVVYQYRDQAQSQHCKAKNTAGTIIVGN